MVEEIKHRINILVIEISKAIVGLIPKSRNSVVFTSWFGERYADNTMYVYEFALANNPELDVCWITKSHDIYRQLKNNGMPVKMADSVGGIWKIIRAKVLLSTVQFSDYRPYWLSKCTLIDLGHGHPIKDPGTSITTEGSKKFMRVLQKNVRFCLINTSTFIKNIESNDFQVNPNNVFISGFARNDVFYDKALRDGKNLIVDSIKGDKKAIVYMPTHRSSGKVRMEMSKILDLSIIQCMCEKTNAVFIIKKHYYHRGEIEDLSQYPNIFDITNENSIDTQVLLYQTDVLISDYSACYIDYLLLNRPMAFYHYDIEEYEKKERNIIIPFSQIDICPQCHDTEELSKAITELLNGQDLFEVKRNQFRNKYYFDNPNITDARRRDIQIIKKML